MKFLRIGLGAALLLFASAALWAGGSDEATVADAKVNPAGVLPIVDEQVTLRVFTAQVPAVIDYEDNYQTQYIEEKTNVKVDWMLVPSQQVSDKLNLVLASGTDLPDVFVQGIGNEALLKYGQEGIFLPLGDYIEEYGFEIKTLIDDMENDGVDFLKSYTAPDGNIYGLPKINMCRWCYTVWRNWVNTNWMETLGLDYPTTVDEYYDMLVAFRDQDPNGNGKQDEIPLMGATNGWGTQVEGFLMMPFKPHSTFNYGFNDRMVLENGNISMSFTDSDWFEGVKFIRRLIEDELLDPVSLTQTSQEYKVMGESDPPVVGAFLASNFQFLTLADEKYKNFEAIAPLKGVKSGKSQTFINIYFPISNANFMISNTAAEPEVAFRWADFQYSYDVSLMSRYGKKGEDWTEADADHIGAFGDPAVFQELTQWGAPTKNRNQFMFGYLSNKMLNGLAMADNSDAYYVRRTPKYDPVGVGNGVPRYFLLPHEGDEYSELRSTLDTYVDESFARFVTGDLPLSAYDDFLAEVKKIGIDRFLEMANAAYKRQYGN